MTSEDLKNNGFRVYCEFSLSSPEIKSIADNAPTAIGTYAMVASTKFGRLQGESDILYIGSATNKKKGLKSRIKQYIKPGKTQKTSLRINRSLTDGIPGNKVFLWLHENPLALKIEHTLLSSYEKTHRELPPWNRSLPKKA